MEQAPGQPAQENVVSDLYEGYHETEKEILAVETKKASVKLFTVGVVLLLFNLIAVAASSIPLSYIWLDVILLPVLFTGLGILSFREPLVASIAGMLLIFGFWIYIVIVWDVSFLLRGWLGKAIVIYLLFAGFQSAREAHRIRRELKA